MSAGKKPGAGRLDSQARLLLLVNGLFITAGFFSNTFLSIYIWKATRNFIVLGWFTLFTHISMAVTFWLAGYWAKKGRSGTVLRAGIGAATLFYGIVLLLGKAAPHYAWILGIIQGIATGLFWLGFNIIYFEVTDAGNRDRFNGFTGVTSAVVGMAAPWISGFTISHTPGELGYRIMFMVSLAIFAAGFFVSFRLHNREPDGSSYDWRLPARIWKLRKGAPWRPVLGALAAQGFRETVFTVMISLLVYIQTGSEMKLGNYSLITQLVAFVSFYATGRWLKAQWRQTGMLIGTICLALAVLPLFFGPGYYTLLVFGIGTWLFIPLFIVPMTSSVFDLIGTSKESVQNRAEYVVLRELGLNAGRLAGMIIFIITLSISNAPSVINWMMLITGSAPIISWAFMRKRLAPQLQSQS
jgi:YQGE family putative transporter